MAKKILYSIIVLSLLASGVGYLFTLRFGHTKTTAVKVELHLLSTRIKAYRRSCGHLPTFLVELEVPADKDCKVVHDLDQNVFGVVPKDPWDQKYKYESDGRYFKIWTEYDGILYIESTFPKEGSLKN